MPGMFQHAGLLTAGAAAYSMSTLFSSMKPVLLTRFVEETGYSESLAGLIVAMPFVGIALASIVAHYLVNRLTMLQLSLIFGGVLTSSELLSALFFDDSMLVLSAQLAAGISVGVLMGATSRIIATTKLSDEIFGFVDMVAVFLMSFMIAGVGSAVAIYGLTGGYLFASGVAFVFSMLMLVYRGQGNHTVATAKKIAPLKITLRPIAVIAMGVLFVSSSGLGFAFMFTLALQLGMDYASAGSFIGILLLVSAGACQIGGWASAKFGPIRPLACAYITCAVGWYLAINADNALMFMIALVPAIFALQFNFPILLALSGSLDNDGQWAAIASPLLTSGFAWAAIAAGIIVSHWNITSLAIATIIGMSVCLLLLIPSRLPQTS